MFFEFRTLCMLQVKIKFRLKIFNLHVHIGCTCTPTIYMLIISFFLQGYTNTDNPFGDAHLLENFVWQKVTPLHVSADCHFDTVRALLHCS